MYDLILEDLFNKAVNEPTALNWLHFWMHRITTDVDNFINMVPETEQFLAGTLGWTPDMLKEVVARHSCSDTESEEKSDFVSTVYYVRGSTKAFMITVESFEDDMDVRAAAEARHANHESEKQKTLDQLVSSLFA